MPDFAIQTEGLSRSFGAVRAVEDVSLKIPAGTIFGFLGPNGSGKTTTIRLLLGLLEPDRGSATVHGFDTRREANDIRQQTTDSGLNTFNRPLDHAPVSARYDSSRGYFGVYRQRAN